MKRKELDIVLDNVFKWLDGFCDNCRGNFYLEDFFYLDLEKELKENGFKLED